MNQGPDTNWLPEPPSDSDGRLSLHDNGLTIEFKVRNIPRWVGLGWLGLLLPMLAAVLATQVLVPWFDGGRILEVVSASILLALISLAGVAAFVIIFFTMMISAKLVIAHDNLEIWGQDSMEPVYRIPVADIVGVRVYRADKIVRDPRFTDQKELKLERVNRTYLELILSAGVFNLLADWGPEETEWAAEILASQVAVPRLADREEARGDETPKIMVSGKTNNPKDHRFFVRLVMLAIVLLTLFSGWMIFSIYGARDWIAVPGIVVKATPASGEDNPAEFVYQYDFGRQSFESHDTAVWLNDPESDYWAKRCEPGDPVTVYIDPDDPQQSALSTDVGPVMIGCHILLHTFA